MKLYNPDAGTQFEVHQRWPSAEARGELAKIQRMYLESINALDEAYPQIVELRQLPSEDRRQQLNSDNVLAMQTVERSDKVEAAEDTKILRIAQASINLAGLSEAERALVALDVSESFWQKQDMEEAEEFAGRFLAAHKRGRRKDSDRPRVATPITTEDGRSGMVEDETGARVAATNGVAPADP